MDTSISFDRAAEYYDRTRDFPEPVATRGIQAILDAAGAGASILDVGTGTGRVSVPLLKRGANLVGFDLSLRMMARLRQKFPQARLAQANAGWLPFPADQFDAVITCHVMHLVGPWRQALREYRRVLKPGGIYINGRSERDHGDSVRKQIRDFWQSRVEARGANTRRPGIQNEKELQDELRAMGAELRKIPVVRYPRSYSPGEVIERIANRTHSHTWDVPEDIFLECLGELRAWAAGEFGDLSRKFEDETQFVLDVARFEPPAN